MDWQAILKWGLLAVAAVYAVRFIESLMGNVLDATDGGPVNAPQANGALLLYPGWVYPAQVPNAPGRGDRRLSRWQRGR